MAEAVERVDAAAETLAAAIPPLAFLGGALAGWCLLSATGVIASIVECTLAVVCRDDDKEEDEEDGVDTILLVSESLL